MAQLTRVLPPYGPAVEQVQATQMLVQFSGNAPQTLFIAGTWNDPIAGVCNITNSNGDPAGVSLTGTLKVVNTNSAAAAVCNVKGIFAEWYNSVFWDRAWNE